MTIIQKLENYAKINNIPLSSTFELTYRCNLSCKHCYVVRNNKKELTLKEIKNILHQLKDAKIMFLLYTGGEVLLKDDFFQIIEYTQKLRFSYKFFTNGTLINKENVKKIANCFPLEIGVSIYSHLPDIHDKITQVAGSFKRTISAIQLLKREKLNVKIKCPLMKLNKKCVEGIRKLANDLGCKYQFGIDIVPKDNGDRKPLMLRCNEKEVKDIILQTSAPKIKKQKDLLCGIGIQTFAISPWGDIYPCLQYKKSCGSLRRKKFYDIWNNSSLLNKMRKIKPDDLKECNTCKDVLYCTRCFGVAYLEDGDFFGKSKFSCLRARVLKKLENENKIITTE